MFSLEESADKTVNFEKRISINQLFMKFLAQYRITVTLDVYLMISVTIGLLRICLF